MSADHVPTAPALQRLECFVGEWSMEAFFPGAPPTGPGGRAVFAWDLVGKFLVQRCDIPHPDAPDSVAIIGANSDGDGYTQHYFDSRGVARVYAMTLTDGVWELQRDSPDFTPLDFHQRFTGTFSDDGATITGRWETSPDGMSWEHDFYLTYTRID